MNMATVLGTMSAGGAGSGCHGPNCGRPKTAGTDKSKTYPSGYHYDHVPDWQAKSFKSEYHLFSPTGKKIGVYNTKPPMKAAIKAHKKDSGYTSLKDTIDKIEKKAEQKKPEKPLYEGPVVKDLDGLKDLVGKAIKTYGVSKLQMHEYKGWHECYSNCSEDYPISKVYAAAGLDKSDFEKLRSNINKWLGSSNDHFASLCQNVLNDKLSDSESRALAIEHIITRSSLDKEPLLYRGIKGKYAADALERATGEEKFLEVSSRGADSWTDSKKDAEGFGLLVLKSKIPLDYIMTSHQTNGLVKGMGEKEFIVAFPGKKIRIPRTGSVTMKEDYYAAAKSDTVKIDLTDNENFNWLHKKNNPKRKAKKDIKGGGPGSGRHPEEDKAYDAETPHGITDWRDLPIFKHSNSKRKLEAGGQGSGCHGPNCGRPKTAGTDKSKTYPSGYHYDHVPAGHAKAGYHLFAPNGKKIGTYETKGLMKAVLIQHKSGGTNVVKGKPGKQKLVKKSAVVALPKSSTYSSIDLHKIESRYSKAATTAAKEAVRLLSLRKKSFTGGKSLDSGDAERLIKGYAKKIGIDYSDVKTVYSGIKAWVYGSGSQASLGMMRAVATDYYGRKDRLHVGAPTPFSTGKEDIPINYDKGAANALIALKALSVAYVRESGLNYATRVMDDAVYKGKVVSIGGKSTEQKISNSLNRGQSLSVPTNALASARMGITREGLWSLPTYDSYDPQMTLRIKLNSDNTWIASPLFPHAWSSGRKSEGEVIVGFSKQFTKFSPKDVSTYNHRAEKHWQIEDVFAANLVNLKAGGPGSGRRSNKSWKNMSEEERREVARKDPRQQSLFQNEGSEPPPGGVYQHSRGNDDRFFPKRKVEALGEPDIPSFTHGYIDPKLVFHPPSLRNPQRVPTDDPGETDDRFMDVTKRELAQKDRMKLLKRSAPGGLPALIPVGTTAVQPHSGVMHPLMGSAQRSRTRVIQRPARPMGAKVTSVRLK